jgi:hypothetical protein
MHLSRCKGYIGFLLVFLFSLFGLFACIVDNKPSSEAILNKHDSISAVKPPIIDSIGRPKPEDPIVKPPVVVPPMSCSQVPDKDSDDDHDKDSDDDHDKDLDEDHDKNSDDEHDKNSEEDSDKDSNEDNNKDSDDDHPSASDEGDAGSNQGGCCSGSQISLIEPWDRFDTTIWEGDGSQNVSGGYFSVTEGENSAAADWKQPYLIHLDSGSTLLFSNRILFTNTQENVFAESGALFLVDADSDGSFQNYIFLNVGYTLAPSHIFVESFGSSGGVDFDQFQETSIPYNASQAFTLDLNIDFKSFRIGVNAQALDTVHLMTQLNSVGLFEVGAQHNGGGLIGSIDQTTLSKICAKTKPNPPRDHDSDDDHEKERLGSKCMRRNDYIRKAQKEIKESDRHSVGTRVLAKMKVRPESD